MKIRGFLTELEAVLIVEECIVLVIDDDVESNKSLIDFVVCGESVSSLKLRSFLREKLPDYMIPSRFLLLESLPKMPNGKINRIRLEMLANIAFGIASVGYVAPTKFRDSTEYFRSRQDGLDEHVSQTGP